MESRKGIIFVLVLVLVQMLDVGWDGVKGNRNFALVCGRVSVEDCEMEVEDQEPKHCRKGCKEADT